MGVNQETLELRRRVELLLGSKHHCHPDLARDGTKLVREYERMEQALRKIQRMTCGASGVYADGLREGLAECIAVADATLGESE